MSTPRVQSFSSLRTEMIAVARGERKAPLHAAEQSTHSADMIARLLTPENRSLMASIRTHNPSSVAELATLTNRAPSNLTRTLDKLEAAGLVHFELLGRRKAPRTVTGKIVIEIDPFSSVDTVRIVKKRATNIGPNRASMPSAKVRKGGRPVLGKPTFRPAVKKRTAGAALD